ncbi:hypothetical protein P5673_014351 [Acropora cervicornis]|uniref:Uncharacterized protein n=1 Tax=Acropora cervicornis TaxID=6130 RepID=A0AAD9QJX4_ACRCE|nr:hypothetical protein P5673_014351 [Acropora cervicornis]
MSAIHLRSKYNYCERLKLASCILASVILSDNNNKTLIATLIAFRYIRIGKTGAKSIAKALRLLGYKVYDWEEQMFNFMDQWIDVFQNGAGPDVTQSLTLQETSFELGVQQFRIYMGVVNVHHASYEFRRRYRIHIHRVKSLYTPWQVVGIQR